MGAKLGHELSVTEVYSVRRLTTDVYALNLLIQGLKSHITPVRRRGIKKNTMEQTKKSQMRKAINSRSNIF